MLVLPVYSHDARSSVSAVSQVSFPGSPSCGTVWKLQTCRPVRTSKPRTSPGCDSFIAGIVALTMSPMAEPTMTMSRTTIGADRQPNESTSR